MSALARIAAVWSAFARVFAPAVGMFVATGAIGGPPGDYGDAPVGDNGQGIQAYNGVIARWTSYYQHKDTVTAPVQHFFGTWLNPGASFCLGDVPPGVSTDTPQNPGSPDNDCGIQLVANNLGPVTLGRVNLRVSTLASHTGGRFYLNVFIDQNRDGQWKDGAFLGTPLVAWVPEWQVADYPIDIPIPSHAVDLSLGPIGISQPTQDVWVRVIVSDAQIGTILKAGAQFWDTTMPGVHGWVGEIEDHLVTFNAAPGSFNNTITLNRAFRAGALGGHNMNACDVQFAGPYHKVLEWCDAPPAAAAPPAGIPTGLTPIEVKIQITGRGCMGQNALVAVYGPQRIVGNPAPILQVIPALPAGWSQAPPAPAPPAITAVCPAGPAVALPIIYSGAPIKYWGTIPATIPTPNPIVYNFIKACYEWIGDRPRKWRLWVLGKSCASDYQVATLAPQPRLPQNLLAYPGLDDIGHNADFIDLEPAERYLERFDEPPFTPFPNPLFSNYSWTLHSGISQALLDNADFASSPSSNRLLDATYMVDMDIPDGLDTTSLSFRYRGSIAQVDLVCVGGAPISATPPSAPNWTQYNITLVPGCRLDLVSIRGGDAHIDDLEISTQPSAPPPPENDNWANAIPMGEGFDVGSTLYGTTDGAATCGNSNTTPDTWHRFTALGDALSIDTFGSSFDTVLSIHAATPTGPDPAGVCNDQYLGMTSHLAVFVTPNEDYFIRVSGYNGATGDYLLDLSYLTVPTNDDCATPIAIGDGVWRFDTTLATTGGPAAVGCDNETIGGDIWYLYTANCNGTATAKTCADSIFDTQIAVYAGSDCPPAAAPIVCNDDFCGLRSSVTFNTLAGQAYLVRVGTFGNGSRARGTLDIECTGSTCRADFNGSGLLSVQDIFDFLAAFFGLAPRADFNGSGGISVQDLFDFLAAYFAGCP